MTKTIRRLQAAHFAFYRAYLEGPDALDLPALADRYLDCGQDPRRVRAILRWLQDELAAAARQQSDHAALRLLRLPKAIAPVPRTEVPDRPTLDEFARQLDPDGVFAEAELSALYRERYPQQDDRRSRRVDRLRERRLAALRRLEHRASEAPLPAHGIAGWFDAVVEMRLHRAGIDSLAQLLERVNGEGRGWYRRVPRLGSVGAARIARWLMANSATLGGLVPQAQPRSREGHPGSDLHGTAAIADDAPLFGPADQPSRDPLRGDIVPFEVLRARGFSPDLSGVDGTNRAPAARNRLSADDDLGAVECWLAVQLPMSHTWRSYRSQVERLLLWAVTQSGRPLSSLRAADLADYLTFVGAPPTSWIAPRHTPRWSARWRPFSGPLAPGSRATLINVLKALFAWLVSQGYLASDPWHEVQDLPSSRITLKTDRALTESQWQAIDAHAHRDPSPAAQRAHCLLWLSRHTGLRLGELLAVRLADVDRMENRTHALPHSVTPPVTPELAAILWVGQPRRSVPLSREALAVVERYLAARHPGPSVIARNVRSFVGEAALALASSHPDEANALAGATWMSCRQTYIRHALAQGVWTETIQHYLGHRSAASVETHRRAMTMSDPQGERGAR